MTIDRLKRRFTSLKSEGRDGLVSFVTAGDPDFDTSLNIVKLLPQAGADIIGGCCRMLPTHLNEMKIALND